MTTVKQIAARIDAHLKRLEADKEWNERGPYGSKLYSAGASASGKKVYVRYVSYQGSIQLTEEEAVAYLAWLDAGNKGTHSKVVDPIRKRRIAETRENLGLLAEDGHRPAIADQTGQRYDDLAAAFYQLVCAAFPRVPKVPQAGKYDVQEIPSGQRGFYGGTGMSVSYHQATPEQRQAATALFVEMRKAVHAAYQHGLDRGRDLLGQLARGDIAIGEFEKPKETRSKRDDNE